MRRVAALCAVLAATACSEAPKASAACPAQPLRPTPGGEAITAQLERDFGEAMAGRPAPSAEAREAARMKIVADCLQAQADATPPERAFGPAVEAAGAACAPVIDAYLRARDTEVVLSGGAPDGPGERAALRSSLLGIAANRLRDRLAGKCG